MPGTFINGKEYTKDPMTLADLEPNAYLVAATNTRGMHGGGSARFCHDHLGLAWGAVEGVSGRTIALPTLDWSSNKVDNFGRPFSIVISPKETSEIFKRFFDTVNFLAVEEPDAKIYMTKVGCGIAGRSIDEMKAHFWEFYAGQSNVIYPIEFELTAEEVKNW